MGCGFGGAVCQIWACGGYGASHEKADERAVVYGGSPSGGCNHLSEGRGSSHEASVSREVVRDVQKCINASRRRQVVFGLRIGSDIRWSLFELHRLPIGKS
jgi:hypothetical protein